MLGQLAEHGRAGIEADDVDAARRQRDGQTSRSYAELQYRERRELTGDYGEKLDRCVDGGDVLIPVVVDVGKRISVRRTGVAIHGATSSTTRASDGQWAGVA